MTLTWMLFYPKRLMKDSLFAPLAPSLGFSFFDERVSVGNVKC